MSRQEMAKRKTHIQEYRNASLKIKHRIVNGV